MKIVIDIPKECYDALHKAEIILKGNRNGKTLESMIYSAVANGKPLDSVLGEIKAEIEDMPSELTYDYRRMVRQVSVFCIIDKYKAGGWQICR